MKKCEFCGKEFKPKHSFQKYCSKKCCGRSNYLLKRKINMCVCPVCGKEFESRNGSKYCSDDCKRKGLKEYMRNRRKAERKAKQKAERTPRKCLLCGKKFIPESNNQKFCSLFCQLKTRDIKFKTQTKTEKNRKYLNSLSKKKREVLTDKIKEELKKEMEEKHEGSIFAERVKRVVDHTRNWDYLLDCVILQRVAILQAMASEIQERERIGEYYDIDTLIADYSNMLELSEQGVDIRQSVVFNFDNKVNYYQRKRQGGCHYSDR